MYRTGASFFSSLPTWAKVIFILIWPVSLTYAIYRMWKTKTLNQPLRLAATAAAIVFATLAIASGGETPDTIVRVVEPPIVEQVQESAPSKAVAAPKATTDPAPEPAIPTPLPEPAIQTVAATVTHVTDGDTIDVRMPDGSNESVRFIGVDTPETAFETEPYGKEASAFTSQVLDINSTVYLETDIEQRDRYGRLLAHVWLEVPQQVNDAEIRAHLFNAQLLLAGYANLMTVPPNVKYVEYLTGYESEARTASAGLWAPTPVAAPPPAALAPQPAAPAGAYIANSNTGKFHHASCSSVDDMKPEHKVPYESRDAAVADGYVPCKRCNP
ncbi:MAG: thermonuclease family protein [Coriobacteriia bacterium]